MMYIDTSCGLGCSSWPDNAVKNEIARIPVLCLYHKVGCDWRGLFKDYFVSIITMVTL